MDENAVIVKDLKKSFKLPHEDHSGLKQAILSIGRKNRGKGYEIQQVLKGVSFEVKKGEFFGIVGRNGSGKSTLLKLLAGIYTPDSGVVQTHGSVVPFIELGVGFNPELTGRENVFLNGALLGFSRDEMKAMYDDIVEFAELNRFMDQKLKNYSSGMQVRLAFSIAIKAQGDILILDEVLAVGDEAFQRKCENYFTKVMKDKTKTVILVTHSMESVRKYCSRAMLVIDGEIKVIGNPEEVADEYSKLNLPHAIMTKTDENKPQITAEILSKQILTPNDLIDVRINYKSMDKKPVYAKVFVKYFDVVIMSTHAGLINKEYITTDTNNHEIIWHLPLNNFNKGEYKLEVLIQDIETGVNIATYGYNDELIFRVDSPKSQYGGAMVNQGSVEWIK